MLVKESLELYCWSTVEEDSVHTGISFGISISVFLLDFYSSHLLIWLKNMLSCHIIPCPHPHRNHLSGWVHAVAAHCGRRPVSYWQRQTLQLMPCSRREEAAGGKQWSSQAAKAEGEQTEHYWGDRHHTSVTQHGWCKDGVRMGWDG